MSKKKAKRLRKKVIRAKFMLKAIRCKIEEERERLSQLLTLHGVQCGV